MVLLYPLVFLCHIVSLSYMSSAVTQLICSSESVSLWYSYDGPLYYLSVTAAPCSIGVTSYNLTYTVIPMFTTTRMGFHALVYYKGQLWLDHMQPDVICEDLKICDIIKGETLHETVPIYTRTFFPPEGEYQAYVNVTFVDDLENMQTVHFNITAKNLDVMSKNMVRSFD